MKQIYNIIVQIFCGYIASALFYLTIEFIERTA